MSEIKLKVQDYYCAAEMVLDYLKSSKWQTEVLKALFYIHGHSKFNVALFLTTAIVFRESITKAQLPHKLFNCHSCLL